MFWQKKVMLYYFLALCVFLIHISTFSNYTPDNSICSSVVVFLHRISTRCTRVAFPLFFILSGALFFRNYSQKKYLEKLKKRFHSLFIPLICWNVLSLLFAITTTVLLSQYFVGRPTFDFSPASFLRTIFLAQENIPFWFVIALIYFVVLSPVFYLLLKNKWIGLIVILAAIAFYVLDIHIPRDIISEPDSMIYYLTGAYIGIHRFDILRIRSDKLSALCLVIFISCSVLLYSLPCKAIMFCHNSTYHLLWVSIILIDCFALYYAFDLMMKCVGYRPFMAHSFWVYAIHSNLSACITKLIFFITGNHVCLSLVNFFLTILLTLVLIEIIASLLNKYCHPLYRILSGNR